jgi:hypothetical protein
MTGVQRLKVCAVVWKAEARAKVRGYWGQKLARAEKLILGLSGGRSWTTAVTCRSAGAIITNITGDILVSAAIISYLGAFDSVPRSYGRAVRWLLAKRQAYHRLTGTNISAVCMSLDFYILAVSMDIAV